MPSEPLDLVIQRLGAPAVIQAVRADLDDEIELYPPELLRRHLDADRVREDLLPDFEKQARLDGHDEYARQVAHARLDVLLEDWDQLQAVLEDRLAGYLDLDATAAEATRTGAWVQPGVLSRLDVALDLLAEDEQAARDTCAECGAPTVVASLCAGCRSRR